MNTRVSRQLGIERLSERRVFAQDFLVLDSPAHELWVNALSDQEIADQLPVYRRISLASNNQIKTIGLHPQAQELVTVLQTLELPAGAVDAAIEQAIDADSGFGFADFSDGRTESVLWINPVLPLLLGSEVPIAALQRPDQSVDVALRTDSSIRVVRFAADGTELQSVILDGSKYSNAVAALEGLGVFGQVNNVPTAVWIDEQFTVREVNLSMPSGATLAAAIGLSQWNNNLFFTGSAIDSTGETRVVRWDQQGTVIHQSTQTDIWALKSSGRLELVQSKLGAAVIVRDPDLAGLLGVQPDIPVVASQLTILNGRGLANSELTAISEQDGEIFIGVKGDDSNGRLVHGLVVASLKLFPSPWQNQMLDVDVRGSGSPSPLDVLIIINELNNKGSRQLSSSDLEMPNKLDVTGDGYLSPLDVLVVINFLNSRRDSEGESEIKSESVLSHFASLESHNEVRKKSNASAWNTSSR